MVNEHDTEAVARYCGRDFTSSELETIRDLLAARQCTTRAALSRAVCTAFGWRTPAGMLKAVSCRVALLRMERDGLLQLPPPTRHVPRAGAPLRTAAGDPASQITGSRGELRALGLQLVFGGQADGRLWNELVARYHYLGYEPLPGAQVRYLIRDGNRLLGALGFSAAAWKVAPRDEFIGWSPDERQAQLHLVVNNARFLLLPWVSVKFLASSVLAMAARRLPADFQARYAYRPVLLETFVESQRFSGTSYKAANWIWLGRTQGRGKLDRYQRRDKPVKDVWVYALRPDFRQWLRGRG
jgi:hypothetical protein